MLDLRRLRDEANVIHQRLDALVETKTDVLSAPDLAALAERAHLLSRTLMLLAGIQDAPRRATPQRFAFPGDENGPAREEKTPPRCP